MAVLVPLEAEHVRSLREAMRLIGALADLGVPVGLVVDDLEEIVAMALADEMLAKRRET